MTRLVARRFAERSAPRTEHGLLGVPSRVCGSTLAAGRYAAAPQNFLENAAAPFHYRVMGSGGVSQPARNRPPTVDSKSRIDFRIRKSVILPISGGRSAHTARSSHQSAPAWTRRHGIGGRPFTGTAHPIQHTMIGNLPIVNAQLRRFGENIHTKFRTSAAIAPILHYCASEHCVFHSESQNNGLWGDQSNSGATLNERSGR
jgi:hypothetical protein